MQSRLKRQIFSITNLFNYRQYYNKIIFIVQNLFYYNINVDNYKNNKLENVKFKFKQYFSKNAKFSITKKFRKKIVNIVKNV